jgi:hypothetical protein
MKPISEYFEKVKDDKGQVIGETVDLESLVNDRAKDLYPKNKAKREAFFQGYIEGHGFGTLLTKKNLSRQQQRPQVVQDKPKLFLPNR